MKTVLIYDSKNYISRFLKFRLKHAYKFIKFTNGKFSNYKLSKAYTYENFDLIIVVVYEDLDLVHLFDLFNLKIPVIVASENTSLLDLLSGNLGTTTVDLNRIKTDIFEDFETKITLLS